MSPSVLVAPSSPHTASSPVEADSFDFRKQPVSPPPGSPMSDHEVLSSDGAEPPRPISLLSSMLSDRPNKSSTNGYTSGPSAPSSAPSTALSSPRAHEPVSILRRCSIGSDSEPFFLPLAATKEVTSPQVKDVHLPSPLTTVDPPSAPSAPPSPTKSAGKPERALKFAVANSRPERERKAVPTPMDSDSETKSDKGYEEDSEDGFTDDDDDDDDEPKTFMIHARRFSLARAHNKPPQLRSPSMSPPPRVEPPPPPRRGRGHVRVDPSVAEDHQHCSRHYSPPPTESRRSSRSAPPGPRDGRAGSPVPSKHSSDDDDEDHDDDDDNDDDDSNSKPDSGLQEEDVAIASESESSDESGNANAPVSPFGGVRNMLRRASEHLPSFRRPSFTLSGVATGVTASKPLDTDDTASSAGERALLSRARSLGSRPDSLSRRNMPPAAVSAGELGTEPVTPTQPLAVPSRRPEVS